MKYRKTIRAKFIERPNRFIAIVDINGSIETVHVKNTGRCKELLIKGVIVILEETDNPERKTKYDLIAVYKDKVGIINIDSQAPNKVAREWLESKDYTYIKPEYTYGNSRIDFYMEKGDKKYLMEVKGCTLEKSGTGYFPDAPTERGVKHIYELINAKEDGYETSLAFVIQINGVDEVLPNIEIHPEFGVAIEDAKKAGVEIVFITCKVSEDEIVAII